ncbi:helix-turn-helix domain-containing protein [Pseudoruegeria sp. SK021]|uniref:helix-turn-helix domain-containing protein n=1 Tax=Pseudoruegeria sp. SK021 TaxID=1933035 RepID=UPI000A21FF0F|nr:helix-turn-helix transcriptional regulator [Pseudoruegeria sp. SK021]OSP53723.1 transcriptional regulator [Pseudoruegeria sp. SK021]
MSKTLYSAPQDALVAELIEARRTAGVTQADLAARLRCHQSLIARIESGQRRIDVVELLILLRAIGVQPGPILAAVAAALPEGLQL